MERQFVGTTMTRIRNVRAVIEKFKFGKKGNDAMTVSTPPATDLQVNFPSPIPSITGQDVGERHLVGQPTDGRSAKVLSGAEKNGAEGKKSKMPHVLCIDDEQDILSVASLSLETVGGYEVSCCSSGAEALERIDGIKPDIILLDVMMPKMSGPQTLQRLKETATAAQIPIVFMTARVQPKEIEEYLELGAAAVVHKPFDPMQISDQIGEILDRSQSN